MAGEGAAVAREVGQESWRIFGHLAAQREAPLNEVTKRCLRWRDAADEVLRETAAQLRSHRRCSPGRSAMLQRSLDVTLVRMCQSFESERQRSHEELTRRQEELAFLATHDALTGLPNRTLILDRVEQMLVRSRRSTDARSRRCSSTSTTSSRSTTRSATASATSCCARSPRAWTASCATSTRSGASAATSS